MKRDPGVTVALAQQALGGAPLSALVGAPRAAPSITEDDIAAVVRVLRSGFLTTGPAVEALEKAFAARVGRTYAVAVGSGSAALLGAMHALGIGPGDDVVVPSLTFVATANGALHRGATPRFADVDPETLCVTRAHIEAAMTDRTRAVIVVHFAGQPCVMGPIEALCHERGVALIEDACHAPGAAYEGRPVGSFGDLSCFSFHATKHIAAGEGGIVVTDSFEKASAVKRLRNHGFRDDPKALHYAMVEPGFNFRMSDLHCALSLSQLSRLDTCLARLRALAAYYTKALRDVAAIEVPQVAEGALHAFHLFVVLLRAERLDCDRDALVLELRERGVRAVVHYPPVHLHPWYKAHFPLPEGALPNTCEVYSRCLSLPMSPDFSEAQADFVVGALRHCVERHERAGGRDE